MTTGAKVTMPDVPVRRTDARGRPGSAFRCLVASALLAGAAAAPAAAHAASLRSDQAESNEGYYQLLWEAEEPVRLVESTDPDFRNSAVVYSGSDTARVVSGKPDGVWYYRLEAASDGRSLTGSVAVTVRHHSLVRALSFFALGAVVFGATLGLILFARP
jgi:hypothetical protein